MTIDNEIEDAMDLEIDESEMMHLDEDHMPSIDDIANEEIDEHEIGDDDIDTGAPSQIGISKQEDLLCAKGFKIQEVFSEIQSKGDVDSETLQRFSQSIHALIDLVQSFGNSEALMHLTEILEVLDDEDLSIYREQISQFLSELALREESLPLLNIDGAGQSGIQVTLMLQNQLLTVIDSLNVQMPIIEDVVEAFKDNSNFSDDYRLEKF